MKKKKAPRHIIPAILRSRGNRMVYEYRIHHINWKEGANITGHVAPFSFINLQYKVYPPHHFFPAHSHTMFEFYAVTRGQVVISTGARGETPVALGPGTAILMAPHQFHSASSERPASVVNVHFIPRWRPAIRQDMLRICGRRLRLGRSARAGLAAMMKLPAGKSSMKNVKTLKAIFTSVLASLGSEKRPKKPA